MEQEGQLYICGTPIGNLSDITLRAIETLKKVDLIAAEDTRRSSKLLNKYNINTPLISYHEHNEKKRSGELIKKMMDGQKIALISDAGMPGISDPGQELIFRAIKKNLPVIPVPGPTAVISALVCSGLSIERFVFEGFLPRKGDKRQQILQDITKQEKTVVFYESPYRLKETLEELQPLLKDREIAVIRELTKIYEEKIYGTCENILKKIKTKDIKGEIVVVVEGREKSINEKEGWENLSLLEHVELFMENGYTKKEAIKKVARERNISRRKVYKEAISIKVK